MWPMLFSQPTLTAILTKRLVDAGQGQHLNTCRVFPLNINLNQKYYDKKEQDNQQGYLMRLQLKFGVVF